MLAETNGGIVEAIDRDGFAIVPAVVGAEQTDALRTALQRCICEDLERWSGREYVNANMVMNLMTRDAAFVELLENDVLHSVLTPLLSDTCIIYAYTSSSMPPGGTNYSRRVHVDCPRFIPGYVTNVGITLALDDFTDSNGAMEVLPGSHRLHEAPSENEFAARAVRVYPRSGEAIVFNARLWHRGGTNRSDAYRHAVTMNVCRSYMRQQFDFARMVGEDVLARVGERGRRFLGFNVRMPVSLDEYYLPPDERPYKPNQG